MPNGREGEQCAVSGEGKTFRADDVDKVVQEIKAIERFSTNEPTSDQLVEWAETMGGYLALMEKLNPTQIRKFLDAVSKIKNKGVPLRDNNSYFHDGCMLLKPKLAYSAGRDPAVKPLMNVLLPCIDRVHTKEGFERFYRFVESIIAYHRYYRPDKED